MNKRIATVLLLTIVVIAAWAWHRRPASTITAAPTHVACTLPPITAAFAEPLQTPVPTSLDRLPHPEATLTPVAGFSIDAQVLSRRNYRFDREALLSPTDFALGWNRMRDAAVLSRLTITQNNRWYYYSWRSTPPIPQAEIASSSANVHLIPADPTIARTLRKVRVGERVRLDGWLVDAQTANGWRWRSSTSRIDTGKGACEVIYVCAVTPL